MGEPDAARLAKDFEQGGLEVRAVEFYRRAAEQALRSNDFAAAAARAERGVAEGAIGVERGELLGVLAEAQNWLGEFCAAEKSAEAALQSLNPASVPWFAAVSQLAGASLRTGSLAARAAYFESVAELAPAIDDETRLAQLAGLARISTQLMLGGLRACGATVLAVGMTLDLPRADAAVECSLLTARAVHALGEGDLARARALAQQSTDRSTVAGVTAAALFGRLVGALACVDSGFDGAGESELRALLTVALRFDAWNLIALARSFLGRALARQGRFDEAVALQRDVIGACQQRGDCWLAASATVYIASALASAGALEMAEAEAVRAIALLEVAPSLRGLAWATLADIRLRLGRVADARAAAVSARAVLDTCGTLAEGEAMVRLMDAATLQVIGAPVACAIASAREYVLRRAKSLRSPWREAFLAVPEHARILLLGID